MFIVRESEIITLMLSPNYDFNISKQLLNSFKTLAILSILWSVTPLNDPTHPMVWFTPKESERGTFVLLSIREILEGVDVTDKTNICFCFLRDKKVQTQN